MPTRTSEARRERGFSLLELIFSLVIAIEILVAGAIAFDVHNKMAVVQSQVTDLQQSLRIAQYDITRVVRLAGRGGLPAEVRPQNVFNPGDVPPLLAGLAVELRNNVADATDRNIARGDADSPLALAGTDILIVRGCFTTPIYQLQPTAFVPTDSEPDGVADGPTSFSILNRSIANINQPLAPLVEYLGAGGTNLDLVIMSPLERATYGVARVTDFAPNTGDPVQLDLTVSMDTSSPLNPEVRRLPPLNDLVRGVPGTMTGALVCALEEYRYYIREVHEDPDDDSTPLLPRLARARFEPGTELPYAGDAANFSLDLADGIFDLQVAFGFDSDFPADDPSEPGSFDDDLDNIGVDDSIFEAAAGTAERTADDWLYNHPDDEPTDSEYRVHAFASRAGAPVLLHYLRITTAARTTRADRSYNAPDFDATVGTDYLEDNDYNQPPANIFNSADNRKFRRRTITTVVDLRNI